MTDHNRDIFIIIPAYNEATTIESVLESLVKEGYSIVVVDDGSSDNTGKLVLQFPVYYLRHPINLGQGAALQTGMSFAVQHDAKIVVHFDADGQHSVEDIPRLIEPIIAGRVDVVLGSRFLRQEDTNLIPHSKRIVLRGGVIINAMMTGLLLTDAHNGFRALSQDAARQIKLQENGYSHASEILIRISRLGLRYEECPTRIIYTEYSQSKGQPLFNAINILIDMILQKVLR